MKPDESYNPEQLYHRAYSIYTNTIPDFKDNVNGTYIVSKKKWRKPNEDKYNIAIPNARVAKAKPTSAEPKFISPNVCLADGNLDCTTECFCNRHFTLNVPTLKRSELSTSL